MIYTNLKNENQIKSLHPKIRECISFIKNNNVVRDFNPGIYHLDIPKVRMHYDNYYSKEEHECFWESHIKYVDVQIMLEGEEYIAFSPTNNLKTLSTDLEKDLVILEGKEMFKIPFKAGDILVFYPEDAHFPALMMNEKTFNKKVVFKIELDNLL